MPAEPMLVRIAPEIVELLETKRVDAVVLLGVDRQDDGTYELVLGTVAGRSVLDAAYRNLERAAREIDSLFDGDPDGWRLGGWRIVNADVSSALLSLHDYLNDVTHAVGVPVGDRCCARLLVGQGDDTYDPECALPLGHSGPCSPAEVRDVG